MAIQKCLLTESHVAVLALVRKIVVMLLQMVVHRGLVRRSIVTMRTREGIPILDILERRLGRGDDGVRGHNEYEAIR